MNSINKYLIYSLTISVILYLFVFLRQNYFDSYIVGWQVFTFFTFIISYYLCKNLSNNLIFIYIFFYQLALSYILHIYFRNYTSSIFGNGAVDSLLYSKIAMRIKDLSFSDSLSVISQYFKSISDYGFPIFLKYIYFIGGNTYNSVIILIFTNCIFQVATCILLYRLSLKILIENEKIRYIIILWGLNTCSVYLNASGLKEPLFLLLCTVCTYMIYKTKENNNIQNNIILFNLLAILYLFRSYVSIFFIIIYLGYVIFPKYFNRYFKIICLSSVLLCLLGTQLLIYIFPEIYYAILNKGRTSLMFTIVSYILSFMSPIPKFFDNRTFQVLLFNVYSIIKFFFSLYAIVCIYHIIKLQIKKFYPLVLIILFHVLLLIVSNHAIDYRYIYIVMPSFFILMIQGLSYNIKYAEISYLLFASMVIVLFNLKIY